MGLCLVPVGTRPGDKGSVFASHWLPVSMAQAEQVGRARIDAFQAVTEREGEAVVDFGALERVMHFRSNSPVEPA